MGKTALITGVSGQDGAYLSKLLLKKGYKVIGGDRRRSNSFWRLKKLKILQDIEIVNLDVCEFSNVLNVVEKYKPNKI